MQRHHLLPCQLLSRLCFRRMFDAIGRERMCIGDFRRNGLLLPANDEAARQIRLPLHRDPHRAYNSVVEQRVGQIESDWSGQCLSHPGFARGQALMRLRLLQDALRKRLLKPRGLPFQLNLSDPVGHGVDFDELEKMADELWQVTGPAAARLEIVIFDAGA
jgi:hypothetical protein